MSSSNRGRGVGVRGRDKPLPVPPGQDRDRGRRGQPPTQDEAVGRSGLPGQRQAGDAAGRGTRNPFTRGGLSSATRHGTGNPAQGGSRAAAAAYEATRRQRAAEEKARIRAGRQNPQVQSKVGETSSSRDRDGRPPAGPSTKTRDTSQPKDAVRAIPPPNANNVEDDDDNDNPNAPTGSSLPVDLPTTYYEALRHADPPSSTYINYPARIHHLKYPIKGGANTPSVGHKWEETHLHHKVSSSRLHTRWARPVNPGEVERSQEFFIRFHAAGCEEPFMGFRPYKDILFLDGQYINTAILEDGRASVALAERLVPFLSAADRIKVRILAVAASAFRLPPNRALVCAALLSAFPGLMHVFLVSVAPVGRPVSAAWDLDTEFARWMKASNTDARGVSKAQRTEDVVGSIGAYGEGGGQRRDELNRESEGGRNPLVEEVEAAFVLARESGLRTAENRAQAEQALEKRRETVDWDNVDLSKVLAPRTPTSDGSSGSNRSSGVARKIKVEPYVMLYFKDAYDRAVSKGWSEEADRTSVDHLDLEME